MNPAPAEVTRAFCGCLILLIPFAYAGLALMSSGMGRSRSAAHSLVVSLSAAGIAAVVYVGFGFAWQGSPGLASYGLVIGTTEWNWIGSGHFFFGGIDAASGSATALAACFGVFACALAAVIPLGTGEERWRLGAVLASAAVLAGWWFPLFAHWVWGGGWLAELGWRFGIGKGFVDAGGAGTIQVVGGLSALCVTWILGPRRGKFSQDGMPAAIPGHNAVYVAFGCFLALIGWFGLNSSAAMLFYGASERSVPMIAVNTLLTAASAFLGAALLTKTRFGKPDASLSANGWTAWPGGIERGSRLPSSRRGPNRRAGGGSPGDVFGRMAGTALQDRRPGWIDFRARAWRHVGFDRGGCSGRLPRLRDRRPVARPIDRSSYASRIRPAVALWIELGAQQVDSIPCAARWRTARHGSA